MENFANLDLLVAWILLLVAWILLFWRLKKANLKGCDKKLIKKTNCCYFFNIGGGGGDCAFHLCAWSATLPSLIIGAVGVGVICIGVEVFLPIFKQNDFVEI